MCNYMLNSRELCVRLKMSYRKGQALKMGVFHAAAGFPIRHTFFCERPEPQRDLLTPLNQRYEMSGHWFDGQGRCVSAVSSSFLHCLWLLY